MKILIDDDDAVVGSAWDGVAYRDDATIGQLSKATNVASDPQDFTGRELPRVKIARTVRSSRPFEIPQAASVRRPGWSTPTLDHLLRAEKAAANSRAIRRRRVGGIEQFPRSPKRQKLPERIHSPLRCG